MDASVRSRLQGSARVLRAALAANPGDLQSCVNLGRIEEQLGLPEQAEARFRAAARLAPRSADVELLLCENLVRQGRQEDALEHGRRALRLDPARAGTHLVLGAVLDGLGRGAAAEEHFQRALRLCPDRPETYITCGEFYLKRGRAPQAAALLGKALALAPDSAAARCLLDLAKKGERPTEAGGAVIGRRSAVFEERLTRAIASWKSGRRRSAETDFRRTLALAPDNARALLAYAEFCLDSGRAKAAKTRLQQALRVAGPGRLSRSQRATADSLLLRAEKAHQGRADARMASAQACLDSGKVAQADAHLRRLLAAPGWGSLDLGAVRSLLLGAARAYLGRGLAGRAEALLRRAAAAGASLELRMPLVEFLKDQGRYAEAARCLEAARQRPDWPADGDFQLGWVYGKLQSFGPMRQRFRSFLRRAPALGQPLQRYCAAVALGDFRRAFRAAEEFVAVPDNDAYLEKLALPWPESWLRPYERSYYSRQIAALERWQRGRGPSPWAAFLKVCLWSRLDGWDKTPAAADPRQLRSLEELERSAGASRKRYGWMLYFAGLGRLQLRDCTRARGHFAAAALCRPRFWWAGCRLAESLLCLGRQAEAFKTFSRLERELPEQRPHVLAWHGEALLWTGRWRQALDRLDRAIRLESWLAVCWRGAAAMLAGRPAEALRGLDSALVPGSRDAEAFIWRGELHRRQGRLRRAEADLDEAVRLGDRQWGCWNRALLRARQGDMKGMREDLGMVDRELVRHVEARLGLADGARTDQETLRVLKTGLSLALGVRRHEPYLREVWMRCGPKGR